MFLRAFYIVFFSGLACYACHSEQAPVEKAKLFESLAIHSDTTLSFAAYFPASVDDIRTANCIIFFDPMGSGIFPVELYKNLAEQYQVILIGNNNSRNGMDFNSIMMNFQPLLAELKDRYHIPAENITLWGFSGGAKAAMYATDLLSELNKVIYGGAFYPVYSKKKILGFAGTQDMNYSELSGYNLEQQTNKDHLQIEFDGKHKWPDTLTAENAFTWLKLSKEESNSALIKDYTEKFKKEYTDRLNQKQYYRANNTLDKAIFMLKDKTNVSYFQNEQNTLKQTGEYKKESAKRSSVQQEEQDLKGYYAQQFFTQKADWWKDEIKKLNESSNPMHQRLVAFFSLSAYSLSNSALRNNDLTSAEKILTIYQLADPTNTEQAFLRAVLYARQNNLVKSKLALEELRKMGFTNWQRVKENPYLKFYTDY